VAALRSALWHEFEELVPEEGEFSVGYFEGKHHSKKWLVSSQDLEAMYAHYDSRTVWCDGKKQEPEGDGGQKRKVKREAHSSKRAEREEEVDDIFHMLKAKHETNFSGPQLRLWARMIVAGTQDNMDNPPNVPMIAGVQRQPRKESFSDAISSAATAIAKVLTPPPAHSSGSCLPQSATHSPRAKQLM
jgi:hypothetical protein